MYEIYCKLRDLKGCKDSDVARATGITKSTFTDWKNGRSTPKQDKLQKIADYFNVTLLYLSGNESEIKESEIERKIRILTWKSEKLDDIEREEIFKHFENTIDVYLKAKGLEKKDN